MVARFTTPSIWTGMGAVVFLAVCIFPAGRLLKSALAQEQRAGRQPLILDRAPARNISDPNPVFRAMAIDSAGGEIFLANDKESAGTSILVYPTQFPRTDRIMEPLRRIAGPEASLGMVCGVAVSTESGELFSVSGESGIINAYSLKTNGDAPPVRSLEGITPRASGGIFVDVKHDEIYITTEHVNRVSAYRRTFREDDEPLRFIQGPSTGLADPHGVFVDGETNEVFVTNHGHWRQTEVGEGERRGAESLTRTSLGYSEPGRVLPLSPSTGRFMPASITVYSRTASGDAAPLRTIQGPQTQLALPDGLWRDPISGEIIVANTADDSILIFARDAEGDAAPIRVLKGPATQIKGPVGVSVDQQHDELWVASWDNHIAAVFPRLAQGNAAPLRTIRTASDSAPLASMGRVGSVTYDPKRDEILAPN